MKEQLEQELVKVGLTEKEAKVYLAALELGPSTAQSIAAKATVNRPTTYVMIESLIKRGLMSSFEKGKKRFFVAGKPTQLLYILENKKKLITDQERTVRDLLTQIATFEDNNKETPTVQIYEGIEAIGVLHAELRHNTFEVLELVPMDVVRKFIPPIFPGDVRESFSKKFHIKSLYSKSEGPLKLKKSGVEYRYLAPDRFPFRAEILIYGNKVVMATFDTKPIYIHIENSAVSDTLRVLFNALWEQASQDA